MLVFTAVHVTVILSYIQGFCAFLHNVLSVRKSRGVVFYCFFSTYLNSAGIQCFLAQLCCGIHIAMLKMLALSCPWK